MYNGIDTNGLGLVNSALTWDAVDRLRKATKMKVVLKGIVTREDAALAREHGADGVIVSNHGGRAEESGRGTIECLPEVLEGAASMPVMIDGGFRRGTDIYKALALGARAAGVGRPYVWGLSAFGQAGVGKARNDVCEPDSGSRATAKRGSISYRSAVSRAKAGPVVQQRNADSRRVQNRTRRL